MRKILLVILSFILIGCGKASTGATFKEQAIKHHYKIELAFADGLDKSVDPTSSEGLREAMEWTQTVTAKTDEEKQIVSVISEEGKYVILFVTSSLLDDYSGIRENMIMYASTRSTARKILGVD